jgi:tetratricopeptide (TPR) repeat protein
MSDSSETIAGRREIRVFISSTFRDMQAERDELVKFIFPELRKLCQQRGVTWTSVDLRWGITEEDANRVGVLSICLDEIRRCRPYFIGILGERYGWVPEEFEPRVLEMEPWLHGLADRSITELEILHGVLNDPLMADHAFFYFRDPGYINTLPSQQRKNFREAPKTDSTRKLSQLKSRIRKSGLPLVEDYSDPRALGEFIKKDFTQLIGKLFPLDKVPTPLELERIEQQAFAESRTRAYVSRPDLLHRLDEHIKGTDPPLTIVGESGAGKTALLANWILQSTCTGLEDFKFLHMIGSTATSTDWIAMLRRCMHELRMRYNFTEEVEDDADKLRIQFANWLSMAAARGRIILVIDALDQLEDRQGAPDLIWLPEVIPENVRVIMSTLPGRPLEAIRKRCWPTYELNLLDTTERVELAESYLSQFRKRLSPHQLNRIATSPKTANPLFLVSLLNELRLFGEYEMIDELITHYLQASSIEMLFDLILTRFEQDYNRDHPKLVQDAFSLIYASRNGLSESELQDLLGQNGSPLPHAYWSPLYLAAEPSLVNRNGLIGFFHQYFRSAVARRYVPNEETIRDLHRKLGDYFAVQPLNKRKVDELPWQYQKAKEWDRLFDCLSDPTFMQEAWKLAEFDLRMYWTDLIQQSEHAPQVAFTKYLQSPTEHVPLLKCIAELMYYLGYTEDALEFLNARIKILEINEPDHLPVNALQWKAMILRERGEYARAMRIYQRLESACREVGDETDLASILNSEAIVRKKQGDLQGALALHAEQKKIARKHQNQKLIATVLHNIGSILVEQGNYQEALKQFDESAKIARSQDDRALLAENQNARAVIYDRLGDSKRAIEFLDQAELMQRSLGDKRSLKATLSNRAFILRRQGKLEPAIEVSGEVRQLGQDLEDRESIAASLNSQALALKAQGDLEGALKLFKDMEAISRELGSPYTLQSALGNQASILHQQGQLEEALPIRKEEIEICRKAGYHQALAQALYTVSELLFDLKHYDEALPLAEEGYKIAIELGDDEIAKELQEKWFPP